MSNRNTNGDEVVLRERAASLARPTVTEDSSESVSVLSFSLGDERYGIDASQILEIQPLENLTPLPCTPEFVAGLVNVRGRLFPVVDLRKFFGMPEHGITDTSQMILVNAAGTEVALIANEIDGVVNIPKASFGPVLSSEISSQHFQGVTSDARTLLDLESLFNDPKMIVHEEVVR